jgi:hypothetical protein
MNRFIFVVYVNGFARWAFYGLESAKWMAAQCCMARPESKVTVSAQERAPSSQSY